MLQDRVVVVTGAGRGIGRDFALDLARHGAWVVVAETDEVAAQHHRTFDTAAGPSERGRAAAA